MPCVGLQCAIVIFPDHTHLLFVVNYKRRYMHEILVNCLVRLGQVWYLIVSILDLRTLTYFAQEKCG